MCTNICIIWVPEEKREKGAENIFEDIITENFPYLGKDTDIQIQEAERVPNKISPRRTTPRHTVIKVAKIKDKARILKAAWAKQQVTNERTCIRSQGDFSAETMQNRREWFLIFKVVKGKHLQPRTLYPARLSFTFGGETKVYRQAKAKRVLHPQTNFIRNVTFLTEKEKATTRNMEIMKGRQR